MRNSLLVDVSLRRQWMGAQACHRSKGFRRSFGSSGMVGECSLGGEGVPGRAAGAQGSKDAGISSEKTGGNPVRRKPEVS